MKRQPEKGSAAICMLIEKWRCINTLYQDFCDVNIIGSWIFQTSHRLSLAIGTLARLARLSQFRATFMPRMPRALLSASPIKVLYVVNHVVNAAMEIPSSIPFDFDMIYA